MNNAVLGVITSLHTLLGVLVYFDTANLIIISKVVSESFASVKAELYTCKLNESQSFASCGRRAVYLQVE
jgi:hypothetical protein